MKYGYLRVGATAVKVRPAAVESNLNNLIREAKRAASLGVKVLVFPELCITAYTSFDLLQHGILIEAGERAVREFAEQTKELDTLFFIGVPVKYMGKLYNCAAAIHSGALLGLVAKENLPSYREFAEHRYFAPAPEYNIEIEYAGFNTLLGSKLIFTNTTYPKAMISAEICEDMWVANPPSHRHAPAGANIIVNLSATGEAVGKREVRQGLVNMHSLSLKCAYIYADAGEGESGTDCVYAGHNIISFMGKKLLDTPPFCEDSLIYSDIDLEVIDTDRTRHNTFLSEPSDEYDYIPFSFNVEEIELLSPPSPTPFVPRSQDKRIARCREILELQSRALAGRVERSYSKKMVVGVSGGLDSTLAMLVAARACDIMGVSRDTLLAVTMPCFGTTSRTKSNAELLAEELGAELRVVDIKASVTQHLIDIGHDLTTTDVTYENAQARERTQVLMDIANTVGGLVVGTGDLSELVLGWATYNGDHMSMYAVNASIPKTLIRHIVATYAEDIKAENSRLSDVLFDILATPVSPELLPPKDGEIAQCTEDLVGPYELHDFFIYYTLRYGFSPRKIFRLATLSFKDKYTGEVILAWLKVFIRRFFSQQFTRSCLPDGPKVGAISVSPRGDLRMPSDALAELWIKEADQIKVN